MYAALFVCLLYLHTCSSTSDPYQECMEEIQRAYMDLRIPPEETHDHNAVINKVLERIDGAKCTDVQLKFLFRNDTITVANPDQNVKGPNENHQDPSENNDYNIQGHNEPRTNQKEAESDEEHEAFHRNSRRLPNHHRHYFIKHSRPRVIKNQRIDQSNPNEQPNNQNNKPRADDNPNVNQQDDAELIQNRNNRDSTHPVTEQQSGTDTSGTGYNGNGGIRTVTGIDNNKQKYPTNSGSRDQNSEQTQADVITKQSILDNRDITKNTPNDKNNINTQKPTRKIRENNSNNNIENLVSTENIRNHDYSDTSINRDSDVNAANKGTKIEESHTTVVENKKSVEQAGLTDLSDKGDATLSHADTSANNGMLCKQTLQDLNNNGNDQYFSIDKVECIFVSMVNLYKLFKKWILSIIHFFANVFKSDDI